MNHLVTLKCKLIFVIILYVRQMPIHSIKIVFQICNYSLLKNFSVYFFLATHNTSICLLTSFTGDYQLTVITWTDAASKLERGHWFSRGISLWTSHEATEKTWSHRHICFSTFGFSTVENLLFIALVLYIIHHYCIFCNCLLIFCGSLYSTVE